MLIRIVKLTFKPENIPSFKRVFESSRDTIQGFEGCQSVDLYQDVQDSNVFFTYSIWAEETDLERYRNSEFFKSVWSQTKLLFSEKPEAWSVKQLTVDN